MVVWFKLLTRQSTSFSIGNSLRRWEPAKLRTNIRVCGQDKCARFQYPWTPVTHSFAREIFGHSYLPTVRCTWVPRTACRFPKCFPWLQIPPSGILVTAVQHNTRALGSQVRTRLIRNGKEVQTLTDDYVHSSTFQPLRSITPVKILAGDQIIVECSFNTQTAANSWAFGGYGTKSRQNDQSADEVCEALFQYYPRIENFDVCGSVPEARHIYPIFRISDYERYLFAGITCSIVPVCFYLTANSLLRWSFHGCFGSRQNRAFSVNLQRGFTGTKIGSKAVSLMVSPKQRSNASRKVVSMGFGHEHWAKFG